MQNVLYPGTKCYEMLTDYAIAYILLRTQVLLMRISCLTLSLRWLTRVLRTPHAYHGPLPKHTLTTGPFLNINPRVLERGSLKTLPDINFRRSPCFSDKPTPSHIVGYILLHPVVATQNRPKSWKSANYIEIPKYNLCTVISLNKFPMFGWTPVYLPSYPHRLVSDARGCPVRCQFPAAFLWAPGDPCVTESAWLPRKVEKNTRRILWILRISADVKGRCFLEKHQESIKYPKKFKGSKKIKRPKDDERYTHNFKSQLVKKLTLCLLSPACSSASDPSADALLLQPQGILPFQSASSSHI